MNTNFKLNHFSLISEKKMQPKKDPQDIETLSNIMSKMNSLYLKKKEELEELKNDIEYLREIMNQLNRIVSNKSFQSADQIYLHKSEGQNLEIPEDIDEIEERYFSEKIAKDIVKDTTIKRKIFSNDEKKELLCILNFKDFHTVEIKFLDPEARGFKETSEDFLDLFVRGALIEIKEKNSDMDLKYHFYKDSDIIESITIQNLNTISEYDLITSKISILLDKSKK